METTAPRNHHPDGSETHNALTFKLGHSVGADHFYLLGVFPWRSGNDPLTDDEIAAIEWETDGTVFS